MNKWKVLKNEALLNFANHRLVMWALVKLCYSYKYAGLLV